jgi:rifampicin phosphotransferase
MNYTLRFQNPLADRIELSGGKGSNLAFLTRRGFPVPPGFIVIAPAHREFIAAGIEHLRHVSEFPFHDAGWLRIESEKLRDTLSRFLLPAAVVRDVCAQLIPFFFRQYTEAKP